MARDTGQLFPPLPEPVEAALRASIERFGVLVPVVVDQHGNLLDGRHRARIAEALGVEYRRDVIQVSCPEEAFEIQRTLNEDRRHLTPDQRREVAAELRRQGFSYRAIGGALGVSHEAARRDVEGVNHLTPDVVTGLDGKRYAAQRTSSNGSEAGGDEWYTPAWMFDALGLRFSIDVCAPEDRTHLATPADRFYTKADDGLSQPWHGTIWCNPPYSNTTPWAERCIAHGDGLLLSHVPINAGWCSRVWQAMDAIRFFQAVEFVRPDGSLQRPGCLLQMVAFGGVGVEAMRGFRVPDDVAANERRVPSPLMVPVEGVP